MSSPILTTWTGDAFEPLQRHGNYCAAHFVIGEKYFIEPEAPRNMAAHRAYFAQIANDWRNLPESVAADFPTPEHLRKHALIKCGYADEKVVVCRTNQDAHAVAGIIAALEGYCIVEIVFNVARAWMPRSQSVKAMGAVEFKASKDKVLDYLATMLQVSRDEAERAAANSEEIPF